MLKRPLDLQHGARDDNAAAGASEIISRREIIDFFRRYGRTMVSAVIGALVVATVYLLTVESIFTARAQILIDPQTPQPLRERTGDLSFSLDSAQVESQIAVLRSEKIATMVASKLGLFADQEFFGPGTPAGAAKESGQVDSYVSKRQVIQNFERNLDVRRLGLSYAIDISYSSRDPEKAARIANALADAYVQDQLATRAQSARQGSEWLEERIDLLRRQMNTATLKVQEFRAKRDYRVLQKGEQVSGTAIAQIGRDTNAAGGDQVTIDELESTASTFRKLYESYLLAYTESVQRQSFPVSNARLITPATRPLARSHPKRLLVVALAAMLGLLAGFCIALGRASLTGSRSPGHETAG
jgi:uncharacterized protein involved in exopolysaccharide biosynthesis